LQSVKKDNRGWAIGLNDCGDSLIEANSFYAGGNSSGQLATDGWGETVSSELAAAVSSP